MDYILKGANVFLNNTFKKMDIAVKDGILTEEIPPLAKVFDFSDLFVFPGFIDVHVHLREPGFSYKETIETGTMASARGGYTHVFSMPNLSPVPDSFENLNEQLKIIKDTAKIHVTPYGSITKGQMGEELSDMDEMAEFVGGFSDDGRGVQTPEMMMDAMKKAKNLEKIIVAHCEDNSLLNGGYIHDGEYAKKNGHRGICSESEWGPIKRDLEMIEDIGGRYHVCHISTKESVDIIRKAKANGIDVTCETGPHYLTLSDMDLEENARFKMNPPLRSFADMEALIEGLKDGTIDMVATDHAPHSMEEKSKGLEKSAMGVVGIETAFSVLYTELVKKGVITLEKLVEVLHKNPKERFGVEDSLEIGKKACFTVFDLDKEYVINPDEFLSKGRSTPFEGKKVFGRCLMTVVDGEIVWCEEEEV